MSEKDLKVIAAMRSYDSASVGSPSRIKAGADLERIAGSLSDRDKARIGRAYEEGKKA